MSPECSEGGAGAAGVKEKEGLEGSPMEFRCVHL